MQFQNLQTLATKQWQRLALYATLFVALGTIVFFKLSVLPGGYSSGEQATAVIAASWRHMLDTPINAPFLAIVRLLEYTHINALLAGRIVAATFGLGTIVLFYALTRYWHGERVAIFGTVLFGTSAWFLHTARFGTPEGMFFGLLALVACFLWLRRSASPLAILSSFLTVGVFLYTPGMVWFIVLGALLQWRVLDRAFKKNLWAVTVGGLVLLGALVPLGLAMYHTPEIAKVYAGLPLTGWPEPLGVLRALASVPIQLFAHGAVNPEIWLDRLPILDFFTTTMFFLGAYLYLRHARLGRFWLLASVLGLGTVLVALSGAIHITILMPFIYLIAASGVGFMLDRWNKVFPRNLIARGVGYGMVCLAMAAVCLYSFRHYFVAWPQADTTKTVYTVQPVPDTSDTIKQ